VLELMAALLLLSALGVAVWSALTGGQTLLGRSIRTAVGTVRLLQMELHLRRTALRVQTPFWAADSGVELTRQGLRVPWLDGEPAGALCLDWGQGRLTVRTGPEDPGVVFGPFAGLECGVFGSGSGEAAGLKVTVRVGGDRDPPLVILAAFGGTPFPHGRAP